MLNTSFFALDDRMSTALSAVPLAVPLSTLNPKPKAKSQSGFERSKSKEQMIKVEGDIYTNNPGSLLLASLYHQI